MGPNSNLVPVCVCVCVCVCTVCMRLCVRPISRETRWCVSEKEIKWSHCWLLLWQAHSPQPPTLLSFKSRFTNYTQSQRLRATQGSPTTKFSIATVALVRRDLTLSRIGAFCFMLFLSHTSPFQMIMKPINCHWWQSVQPVKHWDGLMKWLTEFPSAENAHIS